MFEIFFGMETGERKLETGLSVLVSGLGLPDSER